MSVALIIGLPVVLGTLLLALLGLRLWHQVMELGREVSAAGGRIETATAELAAADPARAAERRQPGWDAGYRAGLAAGKDSSRRPDERPHRTPVASSQPCWPAVVCNDPTERFTMPNLGTTEIIIIAIVIMVLFGAKKMPDAARSLGRSMRIFKAETKGLHDDDLERKRPAQTGQVLPPAATEPTAPTPSAQPMSEPAQPVGREPGER